MEPARARRRLAGVLVIAAAAALYLPILAAPADAGKDAATAWGHPRSASLAQALQRPGPSGFFPLANLKLLIDRRILPAYAPRAGNLLLHALAALLAFRLALALSGRLGPARGAGMVLAVHPAASAPLLAADGCETLLAACFALGAALCFVRNRRSLREQVLSPGTLVLYLLACLSGPHVILLPLALAVLDFAFLPRRPRRWADHCVRWGPFLVIALALALAFGWKGRAGQRTLRAKLELIAAGSARAARPVPETSWESTWFDQRTGLPRSALSGGERPVLFRDALLAGLLPLGVGRDYEELYVDRPPWRAGVILAWLLLAAVATAAVWALGRLPAAGAGLLWFIIMLPAFDRELAMPRADAAAYLPGFGIALAVVGAADVLAGRLAAWGRAARARPGRASALVAAAVCLWLLFLAGWTLAGVHGAARRGSPKHRVLAGTLVALEGSQPGPEEWDAGLERLEAVRDEPGSRVLSAYVEGRLHQAGRDYTAARAAYERADGLMRSAGTPRGWAERHAYPFYAGLGRRQASDLYARLGYLRRRMSADRRALEAAIDAYSVSLAMDPDGTRARLGRAELYQFTSRYRLASRDYMIAGRRAPDDARVHLAWGRFSLYTMDLSLAHSELERARNIAGLTPAVYTALQELDYRKEVWSRAALKERREPLTAERAFRAGRAAAAAASEDDPEPARKAREHFQKALYHTRNWFGAAAHELAEVRTWLGRLGRKGVSGGGRLKRILYQDAQEIYAARLIAVQARPDAFFQVLYARAALELHRRGTAVQEDPERLSAMLRGAAQDLRLAASGPGSDHAEVHARLAEMDLVLARTPPGERALLERAGRGIERALRLGYAGTEALRARLREARNALKKPAP